MTALVATCWTTAGPVLPSESPPLSPYPIGERVAAVADAGYSGLGISQDDLALARRPMGFPALRRMIADAGLRHVEVELLTDWADTPARELLFDAARHLGAAFLKIGYPLGRPAPSVEPLVAPLRALARDAGDRGVRLALEPMPFSPVATIPQGAELVGAVGHPSLGLIVDAWHVFRAGTSLAEVAACLTRDILFGVELDDADATVVGTLFEDTVHRRRYCGEGTFDLPGLVRVVRDTGFDGPWGVEILSDEHRARPLAEGLRAARDTALEVLMVRSGPEAR